MSKYIAVDIGASSGRLIVGDLATSIELDEISRFTIEVLTVNERLRLNINKLIKDITDAIDKAQEKYDDIASIGIDTWAVDFICLDENNEMVDLPMFYRDQTFVDELEEYSKSNDLYELFSKTGIQIQPFNTFFQLRALDKNYDVNKVKKILLLPDYINFVLTGEYNLEYTNATATQCFEYESFTNISEYKELFADISSSRKLGLLKPEFTKKNSIEVINVASHDTASAHVAIPRCDEETVFISSGTWSLLGYNVDKPIANEAAFKYNFSNEGSYDGTYRFQKNIMGLWMIVNYAKEVGESDFAKLNVLAKESTCDSLVKVNDMRFMNPESMKEEIFKYCEEAGSETPKEIKDYARIIYRSLADEYNKTIGEIEQIINKEIKNIVIVGGGAKAEFLNEQIKDFTNKEIIQFPYECSAVGNIIVQAIEKGEFSNLEEAHDYIRKNLKMKIVGE